MSEFTILVKQEGDTAIAKIVGKGSFKNARLLKSYADQARADGAKRIILDLQDCQHMDSTFMGVIAGIAIGQKRNNHPAPRIVNPNPRSLELLNSLGLGQILDIDPEPHPLNEDYSTVSTEGEPSKTEVTKTMLEAHETLVNINHDNRTKFQDVITFLKNKLDSKNQ